MAYSLSIVESGEKPTHGGGGGIGQPALQYHWEGARSGEPVVDELPGRRGRCE
jgi:hypothetical protein